MLQQSPSPATSSAPDRVLHSAVVFCNLSSPHEASARLGVICPMSCSLSSCQLMEEKWVRLPAGTRASEVANPVRKPPQQHLAPDKRWRKRAAGTVWCARVQPSASCCCPVDTPVCATAVWPTSSTAQSAGPSSWSPSR